VSPWLWWTLAAAAGVGAAWAVAAGDGWGSVGWCLGAAALATAGWRERRWRRALRAVAEGLRRGGGLGWDEQPAAELAAAVAPVLRDVQGALEDARRREEQLRELLEGLPWGVLVVDGRRRVVWLNHAAGRLVGVDPSHVPGMSAVAVFRRHEVEEVLQAALQTGEAARDLELGAVLEVRARRLPGGQLLVVVQDVTRERRAEAVRRDFVANVSHELRTPLASLRAMAETLRDGGLEDPQLRVRFLGQMLEEVDRMTRLVNDLLDLSALEAGVVRLRREELQARELLEAVARRYQQAASRRGVGLAVRPGEARLQGDRDRLEQALGNLVDNAVKYTPPGGRVELGVEVGGAEVRLVVEDTGPGVPPEHLPRIFERFYRADPSRSREEGGTGLGLAIAKHIALAHGGRVEACNRPEGGARFAVVLPAA
jgi:two-component system phosphate regulon sensor histidine kinase PhoR